MKALWLLTTLFCTLALADDPKPEAPPDPPAEEEKAEEEKPVMWQDRESGNHYLYLPKKRTFTHTVWACRNREWDVFNYRYLSKEEQDRFYRSPIWKAIPWTVRFAGDPAEFKEAAFWGSTSYSDWAGTSAETLQMKERKFDRKLTLKYELRDASNAEDGLKLTTLCMLRGDAWFRCSATQVCTRYEKTTTPGQPVYWVPASKSNTTIEEAGNTKEEAWGRLQATGNRKSSGDLGTKWECRMDPETVSCTQDR